MLIIKIKIDSLISLILIRLINFYIDLQNIIRKLLIDILMEEKIKLGYWGIRGRGQVLRLLLTYTGLEWE